MENTSRILALETTDVSGSVALCDKGEIVAMRTLPAEQRSARSLAPTIRDLLQDCQWDPKDVGVVAVAVGPGSFTGLRVGIATAKMFAWSVGAQTIGVDALDAIAIEVDRSSLFASLSNQLSGVTLSLGIDAQRGDAAIRSYWIPKDVGVPLQVFDRRFRICQNKQWLEPTTFDYWNEESKTVLANSSCSFFEQVAASETSIFKDAVFFAGPALRRVKNVRSSYPNAQLVEEQIWEPTARGVARIAYERTLRQSFDDLWTLLPVYSRKAAAEERALEKAAIK